MRVDRLCNSQESIKSKSTKDPLFVFVVAIIYFSNYFINLIFNPGFNFSTYNLKPNDSDYYLNSIYRFRDLLNGRDPFTGAPIQVQENLYLGEIINGLLLHLGLSLEISYFLFNFFMLLLFLSLVINISRFYLKNERAVVLNLLILIFFFFPTLFLRPISPIFHAVPFLFFIYLIHVVQTSNQTRARRFFGATICGCLVGVGYPYFALWASVYSVVTVIMLKVREENKKLQSVIVCSLGLWIFFSFSLFETIFLGNQIDNLGTTYLRFPTGYFRVTFLAFFVVVSFLMLRKANSNTNISVDKVFLGLAPALTTLLFLLSPILTGKELEFNSHITLPFTMFSLLGIFSLVQAVKSLDLSRKTVLTLIGIGTLVMVENSQVQILERLQLNLSGRVLVERNHYREIELISEFIKEQEFEEPLVILMPEELTSILFRVRDAKTLWAGGSIFFPQIDQAEARERVFLRDAIQGKDTSIEIENRDLFGVRLINGCNRQKNYNRIVGIFGVEITHNDFCEVPNSELQKLVKLKNRVTEDVGYFLEKYSVRMVIAESEGSKLDVFRESTRSNRFVFGKFEVLLLDK